MDNSDVTSVAAGSTAHVYDLNGTVDYTPVDDTTDNWRLLSTDMQYNDAT